MRQLFKRLRSKVLDISNAQQAVEETPPLSKKTFTGPAHGLLRSSPSLRLLLKDYKLNKEMIPKTELDKHLSSYLEMGPQKQLSIREFSELFDYLSKQKHSVEDMTNSLKLMLSSPQRLDVYYLGKGLLQSTMEHCSVPEQIQFFYNIDKLNLLRLYSPVYIDHFQNLSTSNHRELKHKLGQDHLIDQFHTFSKIMDNKRPNYKKDLIQLNNYWQRGVGKLLKQKQQLSIQQYQDILEAYSYSKKGSLVNISFLLDQMQEKVDNLQDIDYAILILNMLVETPDHIKKQCQDKVVDLMQKCIDYIKMRQDQIQYMDQEVILLNFMLSEEMRQGLVDISEPHLSDETSESESNETEKQQPERKYILTVRGLLDSLMIQSLQNKQEVNKAAVINLLTKALQLKEKEGEQLLKEEFFLLFKNYFVIGPNYHYEVSNRQLELTLTELIKYYNKHHGQINIADYNTFNLLASLRQVMDFKLLNSQLDFKTYISILEADLKTCVEGDILKSLTKQYTDFLMKNMEEKQCNFRELQVIQDAILKNQDAFQDCNDAYNQTVMCTLRRALKQCL